MRINVTALIYAIKGILADRQTEQEVKEMALVMKSFEEYRHR